MIWTLGRLWEEGLKFKASLGYIVRSCLETKRVCRSSRNISSLKHFILYGETVRLKVRAEEGLRATILKWTFKLFSGHVFLSLARAYGWMILSGESEAVGCKLEGWLGGHSRDRKAVRGNLKGTGGAWASTVLWELRAETELQEHFTGGRKLLWLLIGETEWEGGFQKQQPAGFW